MNQLQPAITPSAKRAELNRLRSDFFPINRVLMDADYSGLSGEDRYTNMAYEMAKQTIDFVNKLHEVRAELDRVNNELSALKNEQLQARPKPTPKLSSPSSSLDGLKL